VDAIEHYAWGFLYQSHEVNNGSISYNVRLFTLSFFFRPRLERFCNATETKPVFSILSGTVYSTFLFLSHLPMYFVLLGVLRDYLHLWQDIYFYTSAS
jgi:hypothetical protein